jgi:hypothetical protein
MANAILDNNILAESKCGAELRFGGYPGGFGV